MSTCTKWKLSGVVHVCEHAGCQEQPVTVDAASTHPQQRAHCHALYSPTFTSCCRSITLLLPLVTPSHSQVGGEVHVAHDVVPLQLCRHKHLVSVQRAVEGVVRPLGAKQQRVLCVEVAAVPVGECLCVKQGSLFAHHKSSCCCKPRMPDSCFCCCCHSLDAHTTAHTCTHQACMPLNSPGSCQAPS